MKTLNKIVTTLVLTTMLSLPLFGAILAKPTDVSWSSGAIRTLSEYEHK